MEDRVAPSLRGIAPQNIESYVGSNLPNTPGVPWPQSQANMESLLMWQKQGAHVASMYSNGNGLYLPTESAPSSSYTEHKTSLSENQHRVTSSPMSIHNNMLVSATQMYPPNIAPLMTGYMTNALSHQLTPEQLQAIGQKNALSEYERKLQDSNESQIKLQEKFCIICRKHFTDADELNAHMRQHIVANGMATKYMQQSSSGDNNQDTYLTKNVPTTNTLAYNPAVNSYLAYQSLCAAQAAGSLNGSNYNPQLFQAAGLNQNLASLFPYLNYTYPLSLPYRQSSTLLQNSLIPNVAEVSKVSHGNMSMLPMSQSPISMQGSSHAHERETLPPQTKPTNRLTLDMYEKESVHRRLSAPVTGGASDRYMGLARTQQLPRRLIAPNVDSPVPSRNHAPQSKAKVNHKLIEDHISKLISHNEQVLLNPTLEKVKPRRVYRRNSLDPASLPSHPNPSNRMLLEERLSYGVPGQHGNLEVPNHDAEIQHCQSSPLSNAAASRRQWPAGLTTPAPRPSNLLQNNLQLIGPNIENSANMSKADDVDKRAKAVTQEIYYSIANKGKRSITPTMYSCQDCGVQFRSEETYLAHRQLYCRQHNTVLPQTKLNNRQSVIHHTDLVVDTDASVTNSDTTQTSKASLTPNSIQPHRDICRTRSADAALYYANEKRGLLNPAKQNIGIKSIVKTDSIASPSSISPTQSNASSPSKPSSIPTNKLPPKKKQLQLMRTNISNMSPINHQETVKDMSVGHRSNSPNLVPVHSPIMQPNSPQLSPTQLSPGIKSSESGSDYPGPEQSPQRQTSTASSPKSIGRISPVQPKSPKNNSNFGGLSSRSRSRSPSRRSPSLSPNNLENTVPRSNYKLLLHQINLRNMQDIGYLSEAYYTSSNPNLKRKIANILWSDTDSNTSSKKRRQSTGIPASSLQVQPQLPRRKSHGVLPGELNRLPNFNHTGTNHHEMAPSQEINASAKSPALQHIDMNNNYKEISKQRSVDEPVVAMQKPSQSAHRSLKKEHLPLKRQKANAPFVTRPLPTALITSRSSPSPKSSGSDTNEGVSVNELIQQKIHKSALKKKSSSGPSHDVSEKIPRLADDEISNSTTKKSESPPAISQKNHSFIYPHLQPSLGYDPHVTYCSIMNPQPYYMEAKQPPISMYSQWAVSDPILLPDGLTIKDVLRHLRTQASQSKYVSYSSLFALASVEGEKTKVTDNKDYEKSKSKTAKSNDAKTHDSKEVAKNDYERTVIFAENNPTNLLNQTQCYTSCHNKGHILPLNSKQLLPLEIPDKIASPKLPQKETTSTSQTDISEEQTKTLEKSKPKIKLIPPMVIIQPPSPEEKLEEFNRASPPLPTSKNNLEVSDSDSDDNLMETHLRHRCKESQKTMSIKDAVTNCLVRKISNSQNKNAKYCDKLDISEIPSSSTTSSSDSEEVLCQKLSKKRRKSKKERDADSPLLRKKKDLESSQPRVQDPALAVHPTGACSKGGKDPPCALCSMKAGPSSISESKKSSKRESSPKEDAQDDETPSVPPLTVTVPVRNRDRSTHKNNSKSMEPAKLDRARGNGSTQHWVSTSDMTPTQKQKSMSKTENIKSSTNSIVKAIITEKEKTNEETNTTVSESQINSPESLLPFNDDVMPPNQNPMSALPVSTTTASLSDINIGTTNPSTQLAEVVSEVIRSAARQSQQKGPTAKNKVIHPLSSSRPLIPEKYSTQMTSTITTVSEIKQTDKDNKSVSTSVHAKRIGNLSHLTKKQIALSGHESELFIAKTNQAEPTKTSTMVTTPNGSNCISEDQNKQSEESLPTDVNDKEGESTKDGYDGQDGESESTSLAPNPRQYKCIECKTAFRIAGHLAKHLKSKSHTIAMQKKTLNLLKQHKLSSSLAQLVTTENNITLQNGLSAAQKELLQNAENGRVNQGESMSIEMTETLAKAQVRALFEGNDEYTEITPQSATNGSTISLSDADGLLDNDENGERISANSISGSSDPRPFKCTACKVAFRFQGHLDRHFRSNHHLLAVGHFELGKSSALSSLLPSSGHNDLPLSMDASKNLDNVLSSTGGERSCEESGEIKSTKIAKTDIFKCTKELAETDSKIKQLQALSGSIDRGISLLNHNQSNLESFKNNELTNGHLEKDTAHVNQEQINLFIPKESSPFPNSNAIEKSFDSTIKSNIQTSTCYNPPSLPDGHISPAPVKLQQLTY